jgi:hypothetical protein
MTSASRSAPTASTRGKSKGPRTAQGKLRSSRRAFRHGLSIPVLASSGLSKQVEDLARKIVGKKTSMDLLELARMVAEAQIDLARIRRTRHESLLRALAQKKKTARALSEQDDAAAAIRVLSQLRIHRRLARHERRALSRRKSAMRAFDAARVEAV